MDIAKLVLEYLKALIWPLTAFVISFMFRQEIRAILARVRRAALPGGVSIDFEERILETKELATRVEAQPPPAHRAQTAVLPLTEANSRMISLGLKPTPSGLDLGYYRQIATQDPTLALAGLRIELEILVRNLAKGFNISASDRESATRIIDRLHEHGKMTDDQLRLGKGILSLASQAVHGRSVTRREAERILDSAQVLVTDYLAWLSWGFDDGWDPQDKGVASPAQSA